MVNAQGKQKIKNKVMKIPNTLPRFERYPTLLLVSGDFETHLYLASDGQLTAVGSVALNPREEAKEKQGFISRSHGQDLGAVSHHERYMEELKVRMRAAIRQAVDIAAGKYSLKEICLIAPRHSADAIAKSLSKPMQKKLAVRIYGNYTKKHPLEALRLMTEEMERMHHWAKHTHHKDSVFLEEGI